MKIPEKTAKTGKIAGLPPGEITQHFFAPADIISLAGKLQHHSGIALLHLIQEHRALSFRRVVKIKFPAVPAHSVENKIMLLLPEKNHRMTQGSEIGNVGPEPPGLETAFPGHGQKNGGSDAIPPGMAAIPETVQIFGNAVPAQNHSQRCDTAFLGLHLENNGSVKTARAEHGRLLSAIPEYWPAGAEGML